MGFLLLNLFSVGASKDPSNISKGNEEDAPVNRTEEDVHYSKARPTPSMGVASDNAGSTYLVRVRFNPSFLLSIMILNLYFFQCSSNFSI